MLPSCFTSELGNWFSVMGFSPWFLFVFCIFTLLSLSASWSLMWFQISGYYSLLYRCLFFIRLWMLFGWMVLAIYCILCPDICILWLYYIFYWCCMVSFIHVVRLSGRTPAWSIFIYTNCVLCNFLIIKWCPRLQELFCFSTLVINFVVLRCHLFFCCKP